MSTAVISQIGLSARARAACVARYVATSTAVGITGAGLAWLLKFSVWAGAIAALVFGLLVARPMLRPLSWPRLVLSRENLYLVRRNKKALLIPWAAIHAIRPGGALVTLEFSEEIEAPGEGLISGLGLEAARFGMSAEAMGLVLEGARGRRAELPDDAATRAQLTQQGR